MPAHPHPTTPAEFARWIDHTILSPDATTAEIRRACAEAVRIAAAAACVPPRFVPIAAAALAGTGVAVCTVVGFPHGTGTPAVKAAEAREAARAGAVELDMVLARGPLHEGDDDAVRADVAAVVEAAPQARVKVILETAALSPAEIDRACRLCAEAGAHFVKTSTGFGPGGATVEAVRRMRAAVPPSMGVKASGGIRDAATALAMIEAGATRIGTSRGPALVEDARSLLEAP